MSCGCTAGRTVMRATPQAKKERKALLRDIDRDHRRKARAKLVELREQIRDARREREKRMKAAAEQCRTERLATRERARARRLAALEQLREAFRAERAAAREACTLRKTDIRSSGKTGVEKARAELVAERKYQEDLRRIEQANRDARRLAHGKTVSSGSRRRTERQGESDDEVRMNIPPELVALFEKVKRTIKASPRMSRTEAFLKYAEEHPREMLEAIEDKTERLVRELEQRHREAARFARRPVKYARHVAEGAASAVPF